MAVKYWTGAAAAVAQVTRVTFSAYTSGVTYRLTVGTKTVSYTAVASTSADVWGGLVAAWNASSDAQTLEAVATSSSGVLLTAQTAGKPFTVTGSSSSTPTATVTTVTASAGPNHRLSPDNWLGGTVPASGDSMVFRNSSVDVLYDLEDTGTNFGDITVDASYTGSIGLPATNAGGYPEYRPRFLKLGDGSSPFSLTIGSGDGNMPTRVLLDGNGAALTVVVYGAGQSTNDDRPVVVKNPGSASTVEVYGGAVQVDTGSTSTVASLSVVKTIDGRVTPSVLVSAGVTVTSCIVAGGELDNYGTVSAASISDSATVRNFNAMPDFNVASRSIVYWQSPENIGTKAIVYSEGKLDFSQNANAKTVAAVDVYAGGNVVDSLAVVTWTTGIVLKGCKLSDVVLDVGRNQTISV